jgi:NMD protein affecting ribosome stability and mRNA decay
MRCTECGQEVFATYQGVCLECFKARERAIKKRARWKRIYKGGEL